MDLDLFIVGIGASAGGLAPLKAFAQSLPENSDMAFVIVQHLDPTHESMLSDILGRHCTLPVKVAEDNACLERNTVYVIPPDTYLEINKRTISLITPKSERGCRRAIDHFFRSLARDCGVRCAAIVLSGSGSDGTAGLREIKSAGGLAIVQQPEDADHSSMPQSALDTHAVDKSLSVDEMYSLLKDYSVNQELNKTQQQKDSGNEHNLKGELAEVAAILKQHEGFELTQYKLATVKRRLARRMSLTGKETYQSYLQLLREESKERKQLRNELLINVTDFFRDRQAFETLKNKVVPDIVDELTNDEDIRIWVAGCASGEEAYSIAIIFLEVLSARRIQNDIKIFATDIDEDAIKIARSGLYTASIAAEIPDTYLEKYFVKIDDQDSYRVKGHVRELISFASQNIVSDPPFNNMHLISCRNLLIYLNKEVQEKVLASFYFALKDFKYLFLGSAESLGIRGRLFKTLDKKWRLYKKIPGANVSDAVSMYLESNKENERSEDKAPSVTAVTNSSRPSRIDSIRRVILDTQIPPTIVVDKGGMILYNHGDLELFCALPQGEPTNNFMEIVRESLRSRMRSAFYKARKTEKTVKFHCFVTESGSHELNIPTQVKIVPVKEQSFADGTAFTISFFREEHQVLRRSGSQDEDEAGKAEKELERELLETKEELQNTIEELEISTEELKALHEETLSTNEELQSSNEELEASSEELRSLNEELSTVNAQLKEKIEEVKVARDDVQNFFSSTDIPTLFLDTNLSIQRYTPAAELMLNITSRDIGREIAALGRELIDGALLQDCKKVLNSFQPVFKEVQDQAGRWFVRQATPYKTEDRRVDGVVLVFQDITELKHLSQRAENREAQQAVVAKLGMMALSGADPEMIMDEAVRQVSHVLDAEYCKVLEYQSEHNNLLLKAGIGWDDSVKAGKTVISADQSTPSGYTLQSEEPVIVIDLNNEKRFPKPSLLTRHKVISGISCLINHTTPSYGVLGVYTTSTRVFTKDDANFLQSVANMLSTAIHSKDSQELIAQNEKRLNVACDAAYIGIHDFDLKNDRIFWDVNHRNMWGLENSHEPITFETFKEGLHPEDRERVVEEINQALEQPGTYEWQFRVKGSSDNTSRYIVGKGHIFFDQGEPSRIVGTVQDVTQRINLEMSLQQAVNNLREVDKRKNQFLSILGHELRNPLAALTNCVDIIDSQSPSESHVVDVMRRGVNTMKTLLDDLLDLNRISENRIKLQISTVDLSQLLNRVVEQVEIFTRKKQQQLEVNIDEAIFVEGDQVRLEQIFINLLSNACKYTPEDGQIFISAREESAEARIEVSDNGIGIDKAEQEKVFDSFYQIKPGTEALQGLGIGLALAKKLVNLHNGRIEVKSDGLGQGSTFLVTMATQKLEQATIQPEARDKQHKQTGRKVLFIDDNEDMLAMMPILLSSLDCTVETASDGDSGIEKVRTFKPDIVILDIGLPGKNGHEVATILRAEGYSGLIVALSGYSHEEARNHSQRVGIDYHLSKPSTLEDISEVVAMGKPQRK